MHFAVLKTPLYVAVYFSIYFLGFDIIHVDGCLGGQGQQQEFNRNSRGPDDTSTTITTTRFHVIKLNTEDSVYASRSNIRAKQGDQIYARLFVPWYRDGTSDWTLTLMASWTKRHYTTPLWLFIKKTGLPTTTNFDKTSISFISRKFSRIRIEGATPGQYYVMLEALTDLSNVTLTVSVMPTASLNDDLDFGRIEDNHISYDAIP
jgi:hypothetical protein